jgi:hypothetical protein
MKTFISILALAVICLFSTTTQAQDGYVIVDYMKVKPGMYDKYLECEKAWKTIHQNRKAQGKIRSWHVEEMVFPSGTNTEYDFLTAVFVDNWDAIGHLWDNWDAEQKALPANIKPLIESTDQYRDRVKSEIWRIADYISQKDSKANYVVENFFKVPPGGWDDYMEMETRFVKPVHQKNIDMGNRFGWALSVMVAPQGQDQPYNCSTVDLFEKWEDLDNDDGKAWEAIYPGMTNAHIGKRINATRTLARTEIRQVVMGTD